MSRAVLIHLNVAIADDDQRSADEVADDFLAHSDVETLIEAITLTEEV
jgi:hypothetical protein